MDENNNNMMDNDIEPEDIFNMFEEEFDKKDVINKTKLEDSEQYHYQSNSQIQDYATRKLSELFERDVDPESIVNYDDELRKRKQFNLEFDKNPNPTPEDDRKKQSFKDFLILRKITGKRTGLPHTHRIPKEMLKEQISEVQVEDEPESDLTADTRPSTVLIERNANNEIVSVEVLCTCGKRTKIKLDYEE